MPENTDAAEHISGAMRFARNSPAKFGGVWVDQDRGGVVVLALTPAAGDAYVDEILERIPEWIGVDSVEVDDAEADLITTWEGVQAAMTEGSFDRQLTGASVDLQQNQVLIGIDPESFEALKDDVGETFAGEVDVEVMAKPFDTPTCTRFDCSTSPWKAGINIDRPDGGSDPDGPCTLGFNVYRSEGGGNWSYRVLTAGYCGYDGSQSQQNKTWWHDDGVNPDNDNTEVGTWVNDSYFNGSDCDCQVLEIPANKAGHRLLKSNNDIIDVVDVKERSDLEEGHLVCLSSRNYGNRKCGEITDLFYASSWEGRSWESQMRIDYDDSGVPTGGDSGGPVMMKFSDWAVGLNVAVTSAGLGIISMMDEGFLEEFPAYELCTTSDNHSGC